MGVTSFVPVHFLITRRTRNRRDPSETEMRLLAGVRSRSLPGPALKP
jgi:hypothetical protein